MPDKIAWHYTYEYKATPILTDGHLRLTPVEPLPGEPQGVWFSKNPVWEETVRKKTVIVDKVTGESVLSTEPLARDEFYEATGFRAIRFAIDCRRFPNQLCGWNNYRKKLFKVGHAAHAKALADTAKLWKADPKDWLVIYREVTLFELLNEVEIWDHVGDRGWIPAGLKVNEETRKVTVAPLIEMGGIAT